MRNLAVQRLKVTDIEFMENLAITREFLQRVHWAVNPVNNDIYVVLHPTIYLISNTNVGIYNDGLIDSNIIAMEYSILKQSLYIGYSSGDILNIRFDVTVKINTGLKCMKFSPDHELVAVVTTTDELIIMTVHFKRISETNLHSEEFGQHGFINVGWGKKETQFHGSVGKAAARNKPEELIPNENDEGCPKIAWRKDGTLIAVNFLHKRKKIRIFKIFNREGITCYTSEFVNGLMECITWESMGNQLAVSQIVNDKHVIAIFEKNGLKYSELPLTYKSQEIKIKDLLWSSDILAIVCYQSETKTSFIQLWTQSNAHWYLKQTLTFPEENFLIYATWRNKMELIYLTTKTFTSCTFHWCVDHSGGKTANDKVVCGVIDGNQILITAFKDAIIPPPMAHQILETFKPQNEIVFAPDIKSFLINSNDFCTVSCDNKLIFFKQIKESSTLIYELENSYAIIYDKLNIEELMKIKRLSYHIYPKHHFLWFTETTMLFSITIGSYDVLCVLPLNEIHYKEFLKIQEVYVLDSSVEHIISSPDASAAYIKAGDKIFKYTRNEKFELTNLKLDKLCAKIEVIKIDAKDVVLAVSVENNFLVDGKEVVKNITNFYVHSDFLLLTTLQNTLICIPLNTTAFKLLDKRVLTSESLLSDNLNEFVHTDAYIRRLEKTSRIIAAIPNDSKVILQMPRGNLECIQPRALAIYLIKNYLDNCDYLMALDIMTKQRVNLNLIYDHNPKLFLDNAEKFINYILQHKKLNWLNLFLSELRNDDLTATIYKSCYENCSIHSNVECNKAAVDKVNKVCKLLRDIMENHERANDLIQPILISLVTNNQKEGLEKALDKIKRVNSQDSTASAHKALTYLLHFVDIDKLYDVALGMYDLELAMFIASKSSKDPKEYIPFLRNLKKLDENYMKYSIDRHLKRYESALVHLSKDSTKFDECLDLICNKKLYKLAIKLFKNTTEHKKVAEIYGEFLLSEEKHMEAGIMFYRSGNFNKALKMFCMSNNWEDVIAISKESNLSQNDLYKFYKAQVEYLKAKGKYEQAAIILKEYLDQSAEAVMLLCERKMWKSAIRIVTNDQNLNLNVFMKMYIKPGVEEHAEYVISRLNEITTNFHKYKLRLATVRSNIKARRVQLSNEKIYDNELEPNNEFLDSISDTTSIADSLSRISISSSKSYLSRKNRRKQERKLFSLKEGSMFEDLSLIYALYQIISNAYQDRDEWCQLVQILMRFEYDESAEKIVVQARDFFQLVESSKSEIWDKSAPSSLIDIEKNDNYTQAQIEEMIAPVKSIERYVMYPPETDASPHLLTIF